MKGDFHVRFRENVRVKFPCVTRLCGIIKNETHLDYCTNIWYLCEKINEL